MAKNKKVVVIADIFADHFTHVIKYPAEGDSTQGTPFERKSGGCGGNIAAGMGVLGVDTYAISRVGDDEFGHFLIEDMIKAGVHPEGISVDKEHGSCITMIAISPNGDRTIWMLGKNSAYEHMSEEDFDYLDEIDPEVIFVSGVLFGVHPTEESIFAAVEKWKGKATIVFDPNLRYPSDAVPPAISAAMSRMSDLSDIVMTGEIEMKATGMVPREGQIFIEKFGKGGSSLIDKDYNVLINMPSTDQVTVDTTGAGDTYAAAFVKAYLDGMSIEDAMYYATVAAGLGVTIQGARCMSSDAEIKKYIQDHPRG